jgi:hypothetical protein
MLSGITKFPLEMKPFSMGEFHAHSASSPSSMSRIASIEEFYYVFSVGYSKQFKHGHKLRSQPPAS